MANRNRLSVETKLKILDDCRKGLSVKVISAKYGVPKSSICTIKNMRSKIEECVQKKHQTKSRRSLKECEFPRMEQALYKWFMTQRRNHITISGVILKTMAKEFHAKFYKGNFNASDGWMNKFKNALAYVFFKSLVKNYRLMQIVWQQLQFGGIPCRTYEFNRKDGACR